MKTHTMRLTTEPFEKIKSGKKTIEVRIFDEKRKNLNAEDEIVFLKRPEETEELRTRIMGLLIYPTFKDLFADFPAESFGYSDKEELLSKVFENYTPEEEKEFGVVGIKIKVI